MFKRKKNFLITFIFLITAISFNTVSNKALSDKQHVLKIEDIVVTRFHTEKSSVLNQFSATVHSINDPGNGAFAIIEFTKKTQSLSARVPRKSLQILSPKEKETLFIQINNLTVQSKR